MYPQLCGAKDCVTCSCESKSTQTSVENAPLMGKRHTLKDPNLGQKEETEQETELSKRNLVKSGVE